MADDADDAHGALGEVGQVERVVAGVPLQVALRHDLARGEQVALGVLDGDDARVHGHPQKRLGVDRCSRASRDVIDHHR